MLNKGVVRDTGISNYSNSLQGTVSMCIYCNTKNYRKIYKNHHGLIPTDSDGRSYEIHHIDGNHSNNDPDNLTAITIQEHYDIHYAQGDYGACYLIASQRQLLSHSELSALATLNNQRRVANGTHPWTGKDNNRRIRELNPEHDKNSAELTTKRNLQKIADGSHNLLGKNNPVHKRIESGIHHTLGPQHNLDKLSNGVHPSQLKMSCLCCHKTVSSANYKRWHGENCRLLEVLD